MQAGRGGGGAWAASEREGGVFHVTAGLADRCVGEVMCAMLCTAEGMACAASFESMLLGILFV